MSMNFMPRCLAALVVLGAALAAPSVPSASAAAPSQKAANVNAGYVHTCAVTTKGTVLCWGYNSAGQLGDGTTTTRTSPVAVANVGVKAKAVSAGYISTCELTTKGAVLCWGDNTYGQLGNNTTTASPTPVPVYGLGKGVKAVSVGYYHACALTTKGKLWCWGYNGVGQLGDGTTTQSPKPVAVVGLGKGVKAVSVGYLQTCAITSKGAAKCWGSNTAGQLGDNSMTSRSTPVTVYGLGKHVKQISTGFQSTCAVTTKGKALCWGYNSSGQLGNGTTTQSAMPVVVSGLAKGTAAVKMGVSHACALTTKGKVLCWGANNYGELGDNSVVNRLTPVGVYNLGKSSKLSVGYLHTCVVTSKRAVKCWGYNGYGALGDGTTTEAHQPVRTLGF